MSRYPRWWRIIESDLFARTACVGFEFGWVAGYQAPKGTEWDTGWPAGWQLLWQRQELPAFSAHPLRTKGLELFTQQPAKDIRLAWAVGWCVGLGAATRTISAGWERIFDVANQGLFTKTNLDDGRLASSYSGRSLAPGHTTDLSLIAGWVWNWQRTLEEAARVILPKSAIKTFRNGVHADRMTWALDLHPMNNPVAWLGNKNEVRTLRETAILCGQVARASLIVGDANQLMGQVVSGIAADRSTSFLRAWESISKR
jgi:hypothetical protein